MTFKRRDFLLFLGATTSSLTWEALRHHRAIAAGEQKTQQLAQSTAVNNSLGFEVIKTPIPLPVENLTIAEEIEAYSNYEVQDNLVLPPGFTYDVIAAWGDRLGDSRFGYNNDYISFIETAPGEGFLTVNFEYISGSTWMATYPLIIGQQLPFSEVKAKAMEQQGKINAFALNEQNMLKSQIKAISQAGLIDQGIGVVGVKRDPNGKWKRTFSAADRRITGISGLDNPTRALKSTGPATAIFTKTNKLGYEDNLGGRIIGTFQNCAGGTTPWGTVLSAEENFQNQVPEAVMADGSSFSPSNMPFRIDEKDINGQANVFGLAGNKYGWLVEIDPANPQDYGTKHTWLGRYRHEAFGIRAIAGSNLAIYSGCDRRGGHLYKFISSDTVKNPQAKSNSKLLESGMLYGAKFYSNGLGEWIPLAPDTLVNPVVPSEVAGGMVMLPNSDRALGGEMEVKDESQIKSFISKYRTLSDLYQGNSPKETQGAILIDAHLAATAAGVTCTARPEGTIVAEDGTLFIAFTSGASGSDGGADLQVFTGPEGETDYEYGSIMKLEEDDNDPGSLSFSWSILAMGGEPALGGAGFANPDNLTLDRQGNLWMVTDMPGKRQNQAVPLRVKEEKSLPAEELIGVFGNNSLWYIPLNGEAAGEIYPFAIGPMECECTGLMFSNDEKTLFLSVQHPGEINGMRQNMATEARKFVLLTSDGKSFTQQRQVPIGSNWPSGRVNQPPVPAIVAIRRINGLAIAI